MLGSIEGCDEYSSLGISEWSPEVVEDGPLLGFKDNIKDGDKLWTAVGFPDSMFDDINEDNSDGESEGFPVGTYNDATIGSIGNTVRGVADSSKILKELGSKKGAFFGVSEWGVEVIL